jgi:hypothetical protein
LWCGAHRFGYDAVVSDLPPEILDEHRILFEDVRLEDVEAEVHAAFVIARVLDRGTLRSVRALMAYYGLPRLRRFFLEGGTRQVERRTAALWRAVLGLTEEECEPTSSPWSRSPFWAD